MADCLFCAIIAGDQPSERVAEADGVIAFRDKFPQAPVHVLICPVEHIESAHVMTEAHNELLARCFAVARQIAESEGIADGYRITTNIGTRGGQAIPHLHFHVLGGRQLGVIDGSTR